MCAHRCLRPAALGAGAAASRPQHSYRRAEAPAAAEPGHPQPEPLEEEPKERARRGKEGRGGGGRGRDPTPPHGDLLPEPFSCEPLRGSRAPPFLLPTLGVRLPSPLAVPHLPSLPPLPAACLLPSPSPPSLAERAAVAASAELEMGSERAPRSSSGSSALPARCSPRPRRRCRRLGVPRLQSLS